MYNIEGPAIKSYQHMLIVLNAENKILKIFEKICDTLKIFLQVGKNNKLLNWGNSMHLRKPLSTGIN